MVGTQVGDYRITRLLGEGGMGAVYEAQNLTIGGRVAIKVLHPHHARDQEQLQRFFNEARAVNLVEHAGLVKVFQFGQLENGSAYLVMEHLSGESLAARLRSGGLLPRAEVSKITQQIAQTLFAAHERGIIHRDLKPSNVMLVPDPAMPGGERVKVLDFGIAKLPRDGAGPAATRTGTSMGTPEYMAPEQCQEAAQVDDKADVYSLGVMLFEMLAGQLPFVATNTYTLMYMHVNKPPPQLSRVAAGIPESLGALVNRMLAKSPTARPSMSEVAAALMVDLASAGPMPSAAVRPPRALPRWLVGTGCLLFLGCLIWVLHSVVAGHRQPLFANQNPPAPPVNVALPGEANLPAATTPSPNPLPTPQPVVPVMKAPPVVAAPATAARTKSQSLDAAEVKAKPSAPVVSRTEEHQTTGGKKLVTTGTRTSPASKQSSPARPVPAVGTSKIKYDTDQLKD